MDRLKSLRNKNTLNVPIIKVLVEIHPNIKLKVMSIKLMKLMMLKMFLKHYHLDGKKS